MRGRVLIVEDDKGMLELLEFSLARRNYDVAALTSANDAIEVTADGDFDAVVTDLNMPGISGIELCERLASSSASLPVIVITAFGTLDSAIAAIRAGAYDFITKPFEIEQLVLALDRAIQHKRLREEVRRLRETAGIPDTDTSLVGDSAPMRTVRALIRRIADTDSSVLVTGETGTGKELVAHELHRQGSRRHGPFVAVNCAAMPEQLLESELFGHIRGSFTDARSDRVGLFLQAHGGTLFLDEIGNMPVGLQAKLLRALQERRVRPLGANQEFPFDARLITATNADLESAVEENRFRQDLYFRVNVVNLHIPPLRERGGDILLLAQHFIRAFDVRMGKGVKGMAHGAAEKLQAYDWPGNVRELQNSIERAVALATHELIMLEDLPEKIREHSPARLQVAADIPSELLTLEELEKHYILRVLDAVQGNKTDAARILGLDRKTLYRKLEKFGR
jgi:DNA-binding NtrC family response regulator